MNQYNQKIHHRRSMRLKEYDYSKSGLYFITLLCEKRIHRFGQIKNGKMKLNEFGQIAFDEWIKLAERFPKFKMNVFQIMPDHFHCIIELVGSNEVAPLADTPIGKCVGRWCKYDYSTGRASPVQGQPSRLPPVDSWRKNKSGTMPSPVQGQPSRLPPVDSWRKNKSGTMPSPVQGQPSRLPPVDSWRKNNSNKSASLEVAQNKSIADIVGAYKSLVFNACLVCYKSKNKIMGRLWHRNYYERIIRNKLAYTRISNYIINNPTKWTEKKG